MNTQFLAQAREIYPHALPHLFQRPNVIACGLGYKIRGNMQTDELSLIVSVEQKVPAAQLTAQDLIPKTVDGFLTDVVETGHIRALKARYRPAQPGISIGHYHITAGTLGLVVQRGAERFILSNNHVLANCNAAQIGDPIWQPGPVDGGTSADRLATLAEFQPLDFGEQTGECQIADLTARFLNTLAGATGSSHRMRPVQQTAGSNLMDAALARPVAPGLITPEILGLGLPNGVSEPHLGQQVQKVGRTTGHTQGVVQQIDVTVQVDYNGRTIRFTDQIIAGHMSSPGDSGSAILDMERRAVGLLFAGSEQVTIFTPLQRVLDHFGVEIVTQP
ncbi:MAG: hypothetical protein DRI37_06160 [Chloroflexi bacterium]|nr:MAG: hypothetical protein DRI37_06160 [Chloroflexota bacterium]